MIVEKTGDRIRESGKFHVVDCQQIAFDLTVNI
jgi:hypothetical protein